MKRSSFFFFLLFLRGGGGGGSSSVGIDFDRRVASSSPATDHNLEVEWQLKVPVHFLGCCRGALEQGTEHPYAPRALS